MSVERIDWAALMHMGLHDLRLTPDQFWALTPVELLVMLGRHTERTPMDRSRLATMMAEFPDMPDTTTTPNENRITK